MRTKEEIKAEIKNVEEHQKALELRLLELRQELAGVVCEFKIGERVIYKGAEYEISRVEVSAWSLGPRYFGRKITKSGQPGVRHQELYGPVVAKTDPSEPA